MLNKFCKFAIATLISTVTADAAIDDGVLILTDANWREETSKYDRVLVHYYTPWCGRCKDLATEYAAAAKLLSSGDKPVAFAKVDCAENPKLAD